MKPGIHLKRLWVFQPIVKNEVQSWAMEEEIKHIQTLPLSCIEDVWHQLLWSQIKPLYEAMVTSFVS